MYDDTVVTISGRFIDIFLELHPLLLVYVIAEIYLGEINVQSRL
jgi:hypothetical protein